MNLQSEPPVRAIAFYLPQFHPIPQNDAWWGPGFTEWTNVSRARPLFAGHCQPRLPADLGFYDLRLPEVLEAQAELARRYGIYGFCYYYYFFKDGKRLLERPLEQMLASGRPDFPFCLCWANENWTRRWDGLDNEILQEQEHSPANDHAFMASLLPYFRDPRYIRIDGRPLLFIYRASLFPDFALTVERWRAQLHEAGELPPYLAVVEAYDLRAETISAARIDATCEFPPHGHFHRARAQHSVRFYAPFSGELYDYEKVASHFLERPAPEHRRFKTVTLGWDNTARKRSSAVIMINFSLAEYHRWLTGAIAHTQRTAPPSEQFVFINAWNEWAEGTYLEPDHLLGHAYLEATRAALLGEPYRRRIAPGAAATRGSPQDAGRDEGGHPQSADDSISPGRAPRIVAIAAVGNDGDLVEAFVRENLRFVDRLMVAVRRDQGSIRRILQMLADEGLSLEIRDQVDEWIGTRDALNQLLLEAAGDDDLTWVMPLESTEFIDAADRSQLQSALGTIGGRHARLMCITHAPTPFDDPDQSHPLRRIRHRYLETAADASPRRVRSKLVVNCELLRRYIDRYELDGRAQELVFRGTDDMIRQPVANLPEAALRWYPLRNESWRSGTRPYEVEPTLRTFVPQDLAATDNSDDPRNALPEHRSGAVLIVDPYPVTADLKYSE
jgi:Glycosyltransferase WbsX